MAVYVYNQALRRMVDKTTGEPMVSDEDRARGIPTPQVFGDYPGYQSPITGDWIEGRRARKYDMERHGCVDGNDFAPRKLKNRRFIEKRGLQDLAED